MRRVWPSLLSKRRATSPPHKIRDYLSGGHNLAEAIAFSLYEDTVYDVSTSSFRIDHRGNTYTDVTGRSPPAGNPGAPPVRNRTGSNMGIRGSFLVKEDASPVLLKVMNDFEAKKALVKECFLNLPYFATPPSGAFHYKMEGLTAEEVARLFPEVKAYGVGLRHEMVEQPELMSVYRHPKLRAARAVA